MQNKKQLLIVSGLIAALCLIFVILHNNNKAASDKADDTSSETVNDTVAVTENPTPTQTPSDELAEKDDELPTTVAPTSTPEEERVSFLLRYTDVEIFFEDCICEYDKYNTQVYACFVDDPTVEAKGYAIYIQTPDDSMEIFPVKDYRVDKDAGTIYMLWGDETFERIQGVNFVHDLSGYKIESTYSMESLIGEVCGLELLGNGEDFDNLQVEFTELYEEGDKTILRGTASAIYNASGKSYDISWEIDTIDLSISADAETKTYLSDLDIHPLYASFLRNEISVAGPYVTEGAANIELSFFDDREYDSEFDNPVKSFCLLDLTGDGFPELLFEIRNRPGSDQLRYILGIRDEELICYDIFETHTSHVGCTIYDNGVVESGYRFQDGEADSIYYRYNNDGSTHELIHFFRNTDSDLFYDYYYLNGNKDVLYELASNEEYESVVAPYLGELLEWFDCKDYADIPY